MSGASYRSRGYRLAETRMGDSIQRVAERELGEADRWPELAAYNQLDPPYIIDGLSGLENQEVARAAARVLVAGQRIRIPAAPPPNGVSDPDDIYGTDILLERQPGSGVPGGGPRGGLLVEDPATGDLLTVTDVENLKQALRHRIATHTRELMRHKRYGNPLHDMVGWGSGPAQALLARAEAERMLRSDPRVTGVRQLEADTAGDAVNIDAVVVATDGRSLPVGGEEG